MSTASPTEQQQAEPPATEKPAAEKPLIERAREMGRQDGAAALEMMIGEYDRLQREQAEIRAETEIPIDPGYGARVSNLSQLRRLAWYYFRSGLAPKDMKCMESVLIAMIHGVELGFTATQAIQVTAVINNRPGIFGDAAKALVLSKGVAEYIYEEEVGTWPNDDYGWRCVTKRKGNAKEESYTFTIADAKQACLWQRRGKNDEPTPWVFYPKRMLMFRARGFRLRDTYADVLHGLMTVEELRDVPPEQPEQEAPIANGPPLSRGEALARKLGIPPAPVAAGDGGQSIAHPHSESPPSGPDIETNPHADVERAAAAEVAAGPAGTTPTAGQSNESQPGKANGGGPQRSLLPEEASQEQPAEEATPETEVKGYLELIERAKDNEAALDGLRKKVQDGSNPMLGPEEIDILLKAIDRKMQRFLPPPRTMTPRASSGKGGPRK
jgi:hypothetical protein